jgi:soluble lytic murein transglycosylase-like protein
MEPELPLYRLSEKRLYLLLIVLVAINVLIFRLYVGYANTGPANNKTVIVKIKTSPSLTAKPTTPWPKYSTPTISARKTEHVLHPIIVQASRRHQVDPALVYAIIMAESGYNPKAVSKRGARGLMQLMPKTAEALGVEDSFNPEQNIDGGVRHFKWLVNQFDGNIKLALAAYNAGSRKVRRYQGVPPFRATRLYIKKVFKYYHIYKSQMTRQVDRA